MAVAAVASHAAHLVHAGNAEHFPPHATYLSSVGQAELASMATFQEDFDAIYQGFLAKQQENLHNLIHHMAVAFERHGLEQSLHALRNSIQHFHSDSHPCQSPNRASSISHGDIAHSSVHTVPKSPVLSLQHELIHTKMASVLPVQGTMESNGVTNLPPDTASTSSNTFTEYMSTMKTKDIPQSVIQDSAISNLPFIDENGNIVEEVGRSHRVLSSALGPRFQRWKDRVKCLISWWEPKDNALARWVNSKCFHYSSGLVITLNFIFIIIQSDWKVAHTGEDPPDLHVIFEYCFIGFYTLELVIQMYGCGREFFQGDDAGWNMFDFAIVVLGLVDLLMKCTGQSFVNTSFLKTLRFVRISRVLRMFSAMRMFKEIKIMVDCLSGSLIILFWCSMMLVIFLALFSIFFVHGMASYKENSQHPNTTSLAELDENFGSVGACMFTLFLCATGGDSWRPYFDMLRPLGWEFEALLLFFLAFYLLAFFNVVVGVFCEKAMSLGQPTTEELMADRYVLEFESARELYTLLKDVLDNEQGGNQLNMRTLDAEKFEYFISQPAVAKYFESRGVKPHSAKRFFHLLCEINSSECLDFATFVSSCIKLDGPASSIDLHVLSVRQLHGLHQMEKNQYDQYLESKRTQRTLREECAAQGKLRDELRVLMDRVNKVDKKEHLMKHTATSSRCSL